MKTLKQQLIEIMRQLPSRKHAKVCKDALANAAYGFGCYDHADKIMPEPTLEEVMAEVLNYLENCIESVNYSYADPTDNHKKSPYEDATFETRNILNNLGYQY